MKRILGGAEAADVASPGAFADPAALEPFVELGTTPALSADGSGSACHIGNSDRLTWELAIVGVVAEEEGRQRARRAPTPHGS